MTVSNNKKNRTESPERRKEQLVDAAVASISKYGISGTTMTSVAKIAGLSSGLVNFHFNSKAALLEATLRHLAEEHRGHWATRINDPGLTAAQKVQKIVGAQFDPKICSRKKLRVWFAFCGEASHRKSYRAVTTGIDSERLRVLTGLFRQMQDGASQSGLCAEGAARTLESLFDGFWSNMLMYPEAFSREDSLAQVEAYLATTYPNHFAPEARQQ